MSFQRNGRATESLSDGGAVFFIKGQKMKAKNIKFKKSQVVFEYVIIFAIIIVALATISFLPKIKSSFSSHQEKCVDVILERG